MKRSITLLLVLVAWPLVSTGQARTTPLDYLPAFAGGLWRLKTVSLDGGTHAADITNAYRAGMIWLVERDGKGG
jgi:hypothetical protein